MTISAKFINKAHLPAAMAELLDTIGDQEGLALLEKWQGVDIYVPSKWEGVENHQIKEVIGEMAFQKLVDYYSGERIYLPKMDAVIKQLKYHAVAQLHDAGVSHRDIAMKTGYTKRWVIEVIHKINAQNNNQSSLF